MKHRRLHHFYWAPIEVESVKKRMLFEPAVEQVRWQASSSVLAKNFVMGNKNDEAAKSHFLCYFLCGSKESKGNWQINNEKENE